MHFSECHFEKYRKIQATLATEMNRKVLNSVSMIYNAKESKLEYVFFKFSFKLFNNYHISAHFFYYPSDSKSCSMYRNTLGMCSVNIF